MRAIQTVNQGDSVQQEGMAATGRIADTIGTEKAKRLDHLGPCDRETHDFLGGELCRGCLGVNSGHLWRMLFMAHRVGKFS